MKSFFKILVRVFVYLSLGCLSILLLAAVAVFCFEQKVPKVLLDRMAARLSTPDYLVSADSASFRYSRGLRIRNLRVIDKGHRYGPRNEPARMVMSASLVDIKLDLRRLPWSSATILRSVTLTDFRYPRLPLGYYVPDSIEFPGQPDFREVNEEVKLDLPELRPFKVTLVRPEILGISTPRVEVPFVEVTPNGLRAQGASVLWADTDVSEPMVLRGNVVLDLREQNLHGEVRGQTRQHHIRPMLVALDITNSYQFIDAFTKVEKPVDASCIFDVNLRNNDLRLFLELHPQGGCYNGVPLRRVDGTLDIRVFVRDIYQNARIVVGPLQGALADGSAVEGTVVYENTNDIGSVVFDARTRAPLKDVLEIADVMNDGTLDCIVVTNGVPTVTLKGRIAVKDEHAALNDLVGTLSFAEGSLLGIPMRNAVSSFIVKGTTVTFTNASARGMHGGTVRGSGVISVPESRRELASFKVDLEGDSIPLVDVAQVFDFDQGDRRGFVSGWVRFWGPLETNALARLEGAGRLESRNGRLAQMKLFAGFTEYLAKHVPGVSGLVDLSRSSVDFTLKDGVFRASKVVVEGALVSVQATGTYDIVNDKLDFRARVTLTRNDSLLAKLATPITWPFANLAKVLLDFHIQGSLDAPTWTYSRNPLELLPRRK